MSKYIKQIVKRQDELTPETFINILDEGELVSMLGIQATPGTPFKLNGGGEIQIGFYGTYELDLSRFGGLIKSIEVKPAASYPKDAKIIIDILYELGGN